MLHKDLEVLRKTFHKPDTGPQNYSIMRNQQIILDAQIMSIEIQHKQQEEILKKQRRILSRLPLSDKSIHYNPKKPPKCLSDYLSKEKRISKIDITSLISELQYHLGLITEPGTSDVIAKYKEGQLKGTETQQNHEDRLQNRSKQITLAWLKEFIDPTNKDYAVDMLCRQEGVKECIAQIAVHSKVSETDRNHCLLLLCLYESKSHNEKNMFSSEKYILSEVEKMNNALQLQLKDVVRKQQLELDSLHKKMDEILSKFENNPHTLFQPKPKITTLQNNSVLTRRNSSLF